MLKRKNSFSPLKHDIRFDKTKHLLKHTLHLFLLFFFIVQFSIAQYYFIVLDRLTLNPIPFATIMLNDKKGWVTNDEGQFQLHKDTPLDSKDTLFLSSLGYNSLKAENDKIVVAGGQESMTNSPHFIKFRGNEVVTKENLKDTMLVDGLLDAYNHYHMGVTAENVAEKYNISRQEQDIFSISSQKKAKKAYEEKKFKDELIKLQIQTNNEKFIFEHDEYLRNNINLDDLEKLKTVFKENGTVTPGNSSGLNDGAAAIVLMTREKAELKSLEILTNIVSWASSGVEPSLMGLGPIPSIKEALLRAQWKIEDVDLFEINEAFAAQSIAVIRELKIPEEKVNVNGGAIALGHPIGASGTRILVTLIHELKRQGKKKGCAALCIGGGMGIAMCVERN